MSTPSSSSKNNLKRSRDGARERERNKSVASESGSSQCETPPLVDKDGSLQGKYAGVGPDSVISIAEQLSMELTSEAATNLAEDVSYKLRQMISNIALQSGLMKKTRVDTTDVNTAFNLADTSSALCASATQYTQVAEEQSNADLEDTVNVVDLALNPQTFAYSSHPTMSAEWITGDKSQNSSHISSSLQNYYTTVSRAILKLRKIPKDIAVQDLMTNTRIGPIFPNLFNLAVLVLNDDNLNALNVPAKKPLQCNVLDMVDALCSNPCSSDTNIQQQFQRLFPVMVSNILGNGSMSDKMVNILTKITRTWPSFITIGKSILFEYLSHGTKERLTGPMIKCVMALGRQALFECLDSDDNLLHLDDCLMQEKWTQQQADLRMTMLDVSTVLLKSEPTTYCEDYVGCDYVLYEMIGDSIDPRRTIFPKSKQKTSEDAETTNDESAAPQRSYLRPLKIRILPSTQKTRNGTHSGSVFKPTRFTIDRSVRFNIRNCRTKFIPSKYQTPVAYASSNNVVVAGGLLRRFKYKLKEPNSAPYFGALLL